VTSYVPLSRKSGVQSKEPVPFPLSVKLAEPGSVEVVSVGVDSISVAVIPNVSCIFSVVDCGPIPVRIGSWLPPSITVIVTISESTPAESSVA
jgi:hypothetical protein